MNCTQVNRRQALQVAASISGAAVVAGCVASHAAETNPPLAVGIATMGFSGLSNEVLARELAANRIHTVQLFLSQTDSRYWNYNGRSDLSSLTPQRCRAIAAAYRSMGIRIDSIGVYTNLIHPDEAERTANLDYFEAMMRVGQAMEVRRFATEAGHYHPEKLEPDVPYDFREVTWKGMVTTGKELARRAAQFDATILFEPFYRGFLASAKRTRLFLEEVDSPRVRALLDPANLLEVNDLGEMFAQLGPWIECLHAKDRKLHVDRGVPAGQGDLDYREFVRLARKHTPDKPLVLEYVGPEDYLQARAHLLAAMQMEGVPAR